MLHAEQPKYQVLQNWLREQIDRGKYPVGAQIPTEIELAERFGFSRQTVRQAISALEREGLLSRTRGKGTFVCKQFAGSASGAQGNTRRIGVLTTYLDDYIFPSIINGIEQVLTENGYLFTLGLTRNKTLNEAAALQRLLQVGVDGLIIEGTKSALPTPNAEILEAFREAGIPMVFVNGCYDAERDSYVLMDDVRSGELLTALLLEQGHTQIGCILKSDDIQGIKRYEGVLNGLKQNGKHIKDECVIWYTTEDLDYYFGGSMDALILSRLENVSAVVCYNDEVAARLIDLLGRAGKRVPEDISVVGFDNSPFAAPQLYNLTTVTYPAVEIGQTAAQVLLGLLVGDAAQRHVKMKPEVIARGSVQRKSE